jgi:hypothetical protein
VKLNFHVLVFAAIAGLFSPAACRCSGAEGEKTLDLIADPSFQRGFVAKNPTGDQRQIVQWNQAQPPVWATAQHSSKSSFADLHHYDFHANGCSFRDEYQSLLVHPQDGDIVFGVNGLREFGGVYREKGAPWPHQYLHQRISNPAGHLGEASPRLTEMQRLDLTIRVRLLYDHENRGPKYDPHVHAAHFLLFFTVQNLNRRSKGYGDYYWFNIALYDSRSKLTSLFVMQDKSSPQKKGTEKLMYDVGIAPFTSAIVADGNWVTVQGDLLPHICAGLQEAWKRGYLPDSHDMSDYRIGEAILGWEVPGLNDVAISVKDLRVAATLKAPPGP